jgi:hypothetical protein
MRVDYIGIVPGFGVKRYYKCKDGTYIIVSAVVLTNSINGNSYSSFICETYIFPADENGKITNYVELNGSYQGGTDHDKALYDGGYEVYIDGFRKEYIDNGE